MIERHHRKSLAGNGVHMSNRSIVLTDSIYQYMNAVSLREAPLLRALREETAGLTQRSMQIAPEQGQFMALLARLMGARQCLEVGVFTGYSSLVTALALPDDGRIVACDVSEEWTAVARRYWEQAGVAHKIDLRLAPAMATLDALLADGRAGTSLLRAGGLVLVDNTLWSGRVADREVADADTVALRQFNEALLHDERVDLSLLPVGDGLTLARKCN
jgi:caffeoyl-CoA O-methyltransferase